VKNAVALFLAVFLLCLTVGLVSAQAPSGPPKPGPEHEKLAYFVGKWASEGELKPSAFGPGGKFAITETCDWLPGKFALQCNSDGNISGMPVKGTSIMSYDSAKSTYVYFESNSMGENNYSQGSVNGDTWTWTSENAMYGTTVRTRFTLKQVPPDSASFKFELATGSDPLTLMMEGKQTRQK